ncbi:carboxypeptidase-like regulatory domain-containing protein [Flavobacterium panacagri]|uniref:carboxypeptidase-like regulatory domain-containing protein n=1 Tax=Flavobacterium panacagri TaxID=3034146 RepID=UPI0025A612C9|nr:carboxypeptidase-like regulatory domain-containing protein [Flavobacterium panacagri]
MKNLKLISSAIAMLIYFAGMAQERTVTGIISDKNGALPGVNVSIKENKRSTLTDFDGKYAIKVKKRDTLIFSFKGLKTETMILKEKNIINLIMVDSLEIKDLTPFLCYPRRRQ